MEVQTVKQWASTSAQQSSQVWPVVCLLDQLDLNVLKIPSEYWLYASLYYSVMSHIFP